MPRIHKRNCDNCGKKYTGVGFKYCSKKCSEIYFKGSNHPSWNGGRQIDKSGYILIYSPKHPHARKGYIREHRFVMEQKIGRLLRLDEVVHHINEIKDDNRIENLRIMSTSEHRKIHKKYTDNQLLDRLKDFYKEFKKTPTSRDVNNGILIHRFGTFNKALLLAGLRPNRLSSISKK